MTEIVPKKYNTYFDAALDVLEMSSDELMKYMRMSHEDADKMVKEGWDRMMTKAGVIAGSYPSEEEVTRFYTQGLEYNLFHLRLCWNTDKDFSNNIFFDKFNKLLPEIRNYKILDYGCGSGQHALALINNGCEKVYFADVETPLFKIVKKVISPWIGEDRFMTIKDKFPLGKGEREGKDNYDLIICMDVLEHIKDPDKLIGHFSRHARYVYLTAFFGGSSYAPQHLKENEDKFSSGELWKSIIQSYGFVPISIDEGTIGNGLFLNTTWA